MLPNLTLKVLLFTMVYQKYSTTPIVGYNLVIILISMKSPFFLLIFAVLVLSYMSHIDEVYDSTAFVFKI